MPLIGPRSGHAAELRLSRSARDRYGFEETLFAVEGDAILLDPARAASLAARLAAGDPERGRRIATEVTALGLIHELGHRAVAAERVGDPGGGGPLARALVAAGGRIGRDALTGALVAFEAAFPATPVYRGAVAPERWLAGEGRRVPGPEAALEELLLTWLASENPAASPYRELFDDAPLGDTPYPRLLAALTGADLPEEAHDPDAAAPARRLIGRLGEPARAAPGSLAGQLRWIREAWAGWLRDEDLALIDRRLLDLDELAREEFLRHRQSRAPAGAEAALAGLAASAEEPEAFSEDRDWMSELVLIAKSTYVWLSQLSRAHARDIRRLDEVPDAELDELRVRGFTGLWLIGIWERSRASASIKQRRGDPGAMASAYSVAEYTVAEELGGDAAWRDLRDRAASRGIRLAADMVPNHMGLDSRWVIEHPERFVSSPWPPFESYTFEGPDLSGDERVAIVLEDHYWDSTDAAVVFKHVDRASGTTRYVYHGNDGTSFPWNDTAQLDYLRADVREAVIAQIIEVARRFPVIRFDAAMVLAKRHIQRLWYPLPGQESGIPSRSAAALPAAEFERRLPTEFWREVVDRVAAEAPDTLLLAEAFWLLEGYFVRSLGMHRVYNSAFMHMLRDERNADLARLIRETVAFDPRILGRYVNFMTNPDERSAVDQFGSGDKYFGVATVLATLPGLPMFGHGQVEAFGEQYGMEFRHPQRDERPDERLVARHQAEVAPLLRERWRFAGSSGFRQLTALADGGEVHDVIAYANEAPAGPAGAGERRSLVVYLNRYPRAQVRIPGVGPALGLPDDPGAFVLLRDARSGLDFVRDAHALHDAGLELALDGYGCHVFLGFDLVSGGAWAELARRVGLAGVHDAHAAEARLREEPLRAAAAAVFEAPEAGPAFAIPVALVEAEREAAEGAAALAAALEALARLAGRDDAPASVADRAAADLRHLEAVEPRRVAAAVGGWILARAIGEIARGGEPGHAADAFLDWEGAAALGARLRSEGFSDADAWRAVELTGALLAVPPGGLAEAASGPGLPEAWLGAEPVRAAVGWHEWDGQTYLVAEAWDELLVALAARDDHGVPGAGAAAARTLRQRAARIGYRVTPAEAVARDR